MSDRITITLAQIDAGTQCVNHFNSIAHGGSENRNLAFALFAIAHNAIDSVPEEYKSIVEPFREDMGTDVLRSPIEEIDYSESGLMGAAKEAAAAAAENADDETATDPAESDTDETATDSAAQPDEAGDGSEPSETSSEEPSEDDSETGGTDEPGEVDDPDWAGDDEPEEGDEGEAPKPAPKGKGRGRKKT